MGGVFFDEFSSLDSLDLILFPVSIGVTLWGVARLAYDMGRVYSKFFTIIRLKKKEDPKQSVLKRTNEKRNLATMSMWGGISDLATMSTIRSMTHKTRQEIRSMSEDQIAGAQQTTTDKNGTSVAV